MNLTLNDWSKTFTDLYDRTKENFFNRFSESSLSKIRKNDRAMADEFSARNIIGRGDKIPLFELVNYDGVLFDMGKELDKNHVVLSFYRGAWCPFCNLEIGMLQDRYDEIRDLGANVVAISPQNPDYSILFKARHNILFPVLSDVGNSVSKQFGLDYEIAPEVNEIFHYEMGLDFSEYNACPKDILPVPATYIIDRKGNVRYSFVNPDYTQRLDPEIIIEELKKLKQEEELLLQVA